MSLLDGFNANDVPKNKAIPDGHEAVCIANSVTDHESKDGSGAYIKAEIEVIDGPYKGTKVWPMFNLKNANEKAVTIAKQQLAQLCLAIGVTAPKSNEELVNKPFRATFGKPGEFNGEEQSRIKKYAPLGGSAGVTAGLGGGQPAAKPSWAR